MNQPGMQAVRISITQGPSPVFELLPSAYILGFVPEGRREPRPARTRVNLADAARQRDVCRDAWASRVVVHLEYTEEAGTLRRVPVLAIKVGPDSSTATLVVDLGRP
jgi:hypothetical protein